MARKLMVITVVVFAAIAITFVFTYNSILMSEVKIHQSWTEGYEWYASKSFAVENYLNALPDSVKSESEDIQALAANHVEILKVKPSEDLSKIRGSLRFIELLDALKMDIRNCVEQNIEAPTQLTELLTNPEENLIEFRHHIASKILERNELLESFRGSLIGTFMGKQVLTTSFN